MVLEPRFIKIGFCVGPHLERYGCFEKFGTNDEYAALAMYCSVSA